MEPREPRRAWLLMAAGEDSGHGGNTGYDDQVDAYYSWDSKVQNHKNLQVGDAVALWDKKRLLGVSVIEAIDKEPGTKLLNRCPSCTTTRISPRERTLPRFRCMKCGHEFDKPTAEVVDVDLYRARYDAAWTPLDAVGLDAPAIRALTDKPQGFNAMRGLDWAAFSDALVARDAGRAVDRVAARVDLRWESTTPSAELTGGFTHSLVRVRRGQQRFRDHLLATQGSRCAFTGAAPPRVLEAGHLYSYAQLGTHFEHGGLMLRRDVHRLFDDGLLAVEPSRLHVDVAPDLARYPQYARLHDRPLTLDLRDEQIDWLGKHWDEHRAAPA